MPLLISPQRSEPSEYLDLYKRGQTAVPAAPLFHRALSDPALVSRLNVAAMTLGYRLV